MENPPDRRPRSRTARLPIADRRANTCATERRTHRSISQRCVTTTTHSSNPGNSHGVYGAILEREETVKVANYRFAIAAVLGAALFAFGVAAPARAQSSAAKLKLYGDPSTG